MKTRFLNILLLTALCNIAAAQEDANVNSLLKKLNAANTDTARAFIYSRLCFAYCTINTDSALFYGNKSMVLAMQADDEKSIGTANNVIGWAYACKGDNVLAEKYLNAALQQFKNSGDKNSTAASLANLGNVYLNQSNYPLALSYFSQAFNSFEETKDEFSAAEMLFSIGRIYNIEQNPAKARNYFQQAYDIHRRAGDELYMAQALTSIANTYQLEEKFDTALYYYKKLIPVFIKHNDLYRTGNAYENIAIAYENKNEYAEALQNMLIAKKYYQQINAKTDLAYAYSELAEIYNLLNNPESAFENYETALQYAVEMNDRTLQQSVLAGLSTIYVKKGDYKNAYLTLDSSYKLKDSLFTKDKQDQLLKLQTEFETERKEKENQKLKAQNLASSLQLERNNEWLITAIAALMVAGILLYALYRNRRSKIKNIDRLKDLNARLEEQKEEITRINSILELKALRAQMNPHFIFNCMSSIQECMLTGRLDDANIYLTKLSRLLRMVLNYSDEENISLDKELQMLTLYLQLEKVRLKNNFEFAVDIDEDISTDELLVPALILQPIAENAIWHGLVNKSNERKLTITGIIKHEFLCFYILDNGIGRKKAEELKNESIKHTSKGIALIEKRLSIINRTHNTHARLLVHDLYDDNKNPTGTCVEIELPLMVI
ncbi:MAG: tetratricopeptide repeat protein [Parafilimonas sp.]|nr:tetratricopeptide repeat protein [Parafilimonas sp.]